MTDRRIKQILLLFSIGLIIFNSVQFMSAAPTIFRPSAVAREEPGAEYADLKPLTASEKRIGYLKDWDIRHETVHRLLAAQFQLAPVVLDPDETSRALWLIDSWAPESLSSLLTATHGTPLVINKFHKAIALKP
jgi:hypothetical protein